VVFERFTEEARQVVVGAVDAAQEVGADRIGTGHLLAALAAAPGPAGRVLAEAGVTRARVIADLPGPVDPAALRAVGIDWDQVRAAVDASFGPGTLERALRRPRRRLPFAPEAKQALARSVRTAAAARDRRIGADHLLLGLLEDSDAAAVTVLTRYGVDLDALRAQLRRPGGERRAG
jgi:ATP-dependent Clp protease ATP-binding subunit ClpA